MEGFLVSLRVAAGVSLVFLVPGLPWSYALLARDRLSISETLGVSAALSIALVPFGLFLLNILFGVPVNVETTLLLVLVVTLMGTLAALRRTSLRARALSMGHAGGAWHLRRPNLAASARSAVRPLALAIIMGLAFFTTMIPRLDYEYPLHQDEWTHLAEARTIVASGTIPFDDAVTGEARSTPYHEVGYHLFLAEFYLLTGLSWLTIFRFIPGGIFALTVLCAYVFGTRRGFGLEAALFASLLPTTLRFLGPGFAVPMAVALLFVPLILFLVSNVWTSRGLPVLLLPLLCFLFIAHPPTALFASAIVVVHGLFQSVRPVSARRPEARRPLVQLAAVVGVIALSSLPFFVYNHGIIGTAAGQAALPNEVLTAPGGMIPRLGYIPYALFVIGLGVLAMTGRRTDRALLVVTVLVATIVFLYYSFRVGPEVVYSRSVLYLSLLLLLIAALATSRIRGWLAASLRTRWAGGASAVAAGLVVVLLALPSLGLSLQSRYDEDYYHLIDDKKYRDFVWVGDNLGQEYERALILPKLARPFAAITGKQAYVAVPLTVLPLRSPRVEEASQVLQDGVPDADWLRERGVTIVYSEKPARNRELVEVHDRVYVLPPAEVCTAGG